LVALDGTGQPVGEGAWFLTAGSSILIRFPQRSGPLQAFTFSASTSSDLMRCGVAVGGAGVPIAWPPEHSWIADPISASSGEVAFRDESPAPSNLDLRFRDPTCQVTPPPKNYCQHFTLVPQDVALLCSCAPKAIAVLGPDLALIEADPPPIPDPTCEATVCRDKNRAYLVHRSSGSVEVVGADNTFSLDAAYVGSGTTAFFTTSTSFFALDISSKTASQRPMAATRLARAGDQVLAYGFASLELLGFAAGSTRSEVLQTLPWFMLSLSAPSSDHILALPMTNTSSAFSQPALLSTFESGAWRDETLSDVTTDLSSKVITGPSGTVMIADDASYVYEHGHTSGNVQVYYRANGDAAFRIIAPKVIRSSYPAGAAVGSGFLFSFHQALQIDTVLGFDGKTTCDLGVTYGPGLITHAPLVIDFNPKLGLGVWAGTTETNIPRMVWFTMQ
jgi:hypothetical protein